MPASSVSIHFKKKKKKKRKISFAQSHECRSCISYIKRLNRHTHAFAGDFVSWASAFLVFVDRNHCWQKIVVPQVKNSLERKMYDCQSTLALQGAKKSLWESLLPSLLSASVWSHCGLESHKHCSSADLAVTQLGF